MKRPANPSRGALTVALVRLFECMRVDVDDRVQPILVQRDSRERLLDQLVRRHAVALERHAHVRDRGFYDGESSLLRA